MIKTIIAWTTEELDQRVNDFEKMPKNSVFATQTHVTQIGTYEGTRMQYTAIIFYKERVI